MHFTKKGLDHLLRMTSYLVTIVTDYYQTCLKMRADDKRIAPENVRLRKVAKFGVDSLRWLPRVNWPWAA